MATPRRIHQRIARHVAQGDLYDAVILCRSLALVPAEGAINEILEACDDRSFLTQQAERCLKEHQFEHALLYLTAAHRSAAQRFRPKGAGV